MQDFFDLIRIRHWVKNFVLFVPLFFTPHMWAMPHVLSVLMAVFSFSCAASVMYLLNDWQDRHRDALHPVKKNRPIASGAFGGKAVVFVALLLCALAALTGYELNVSFQALVLLYAVNNVLYSFYCRSKALLDVFCIAAGFVIRVAAGAFVIGILPSSWLLICTGFLALFIAFEKRRDDLHQDVSGAFRPALEGYNHAFLNVCTTLVLGSLLSFYLIYVTSPEIEARFGSDKIYWTVPFVVLGFLRYLQISLVEERSGSPVKIAFKDTFMKVCILLWGGIFVAILADII